MIIERSKNATRNIVYGTLLKMYQIIVPFIMRTAMIYFMGVQYLGLNSLFTSILQVLNLAELGVGSAMVYSMYKPIAMDDTERICALMRLYKYYYRVIGIVIAIVGLLLVPLIPALVHSDLPPDVNIYVLYIIHLSATVFSYWLFAYKNALLQAHQRNDVVSKITLVIDTCKYISQLFVLVFIKNYYAYIIIVLFTQLLTNVVTAIIATKMYPKYKAEGVLQKEDTKRINQRIRDLFTSKVGAIVVNSADTIVISDLLGLRILAIYQNYFFVLTAIIGLVDVVFAACMAGIGNSIIVETQEKNYKDLKVFTLIIVWIAGFCATCFLCLFQPFMSIWVGESLKLEMPAVICFSTYYFIYEINRLLNTYKDAGGIWHKDRFRPLVTAFTNLGMNLVMVQFWGIYGVLLSTVISMLVVGMPWLLHNLFTTLFDNRFVKDYLLSLVFYLLVSTAVAAATFYICSFTNSSPWGTLFLRGLICIIFSNTVFLLIYRNLSDFTLAVMLMDRITKGKIGLSKLVYRNR